MRLPEFSVKKPIFTSMIYAAIVLLGVVTLVSMKVDLLPKIDPPVITVLTTWPGASAIEIEQRVSKKLEDQLGMIEGVSDLYSKSVDNLSVVSAKFKWGTDLDVKVGDVRDAVNFAKRRMPSDIEEPIIFRMSSGTVPVLEIALTAGASYPGLYHYADSVLVEDLKRVPGVGQVLVYGGLRREIRVAMDLAKLEAYGLAPQAIAAALERENLNAPAGPLKEGRIAFNVRVPGRFRDISEIRGLVVGAWQGRPVHLGDVASVEDTFKELEMNGWVNDKPSVILIVLKNSDANTMEVAKGVKEKLQELKAELPSDIETTILMDTSEYIGNSIRDLSHSLYWGIVLVFLVTWAFLKRFSASLVVCAAIPFSLLITFTVMKLLGYTLNIMTLMALSMAVGMVVDNAIVSTDQIIYHMEKGERRGIASILGASEVGGALLGSTTTTVVVLMPLIFVQGLVGVFFTSLCVVMIVAVAISLFVSISFIPMAGSKAFSTETENLRLHGYTEKFLRKLESGYRDLLSWGLDRPAEIFGIAALFMLLTITGFKFIGTELTPEADTSEISITFRLPEGTRLEATDALVREVVEYARKNVPEQKYVFGWDGQTEEGYGIATGSEEGSNVGTVGLKLVDKAERNRSAFEVAEQIRKWLAKKPGIQKMTVLVTSPIQAMFLGSKPVNIEVYGDDLKETVQVAEEIKNRLARIPGAVDVTLSQKPDRPEIQVLIDREKAALLGVSTASIASTLRMYFYGVETGESFWQGEDDYPIRIRLDSRQRDTMGVLDRLVVPASTGKAVRLSTVARIVQDSGPSEVNRKNRQRYVVVESNVQGRSLGQVTEAAKKEIASMNLPPGTKIAFGGQVQEQGDAFRQLGLLVLLGIILVYMVIAAQYEALLDPFIILFSVPFALTGVVMAFLLTGLYISMQAFLGVIMLVGIVVNNAIVLLDYVGLLRARGMRLREALLEAGERRLRPILMTMLAAFLGMLPMAVSRGQGAEMWRPLAVSVMGGLALSTLITLILVPTVYQVMETKLRRKPRFAEAKGGE
ncbi:MAG: efflux RND transporter permease subunit [Synergistaceae bacterium]|nr:efflux RND transporter permease subunit [Synergistaceae bacterium]